MSAYPRPIHCVKCERDLRPEKNGVFLVELTRRSRDGESYPYAIWHADLWMCPQCKVKIISGYSAEPTYHYQEGFGSLLKLVQLREVYYNHE